jgi:DNA polymerase elongation subunit (family B)
MEFMLSYLKGDGHCYGNYYGCTTVSRNLANSLALLASSLGLYFNINRQKPSVSKIKGRTIICSGSYFITIKGFGELKRRSYNYPFTIPVEFCPEGFRTKNRKIIFRKELAAWAKRNGDYKTKRFAESNLSLDRIVSIKEIESRSDFVYDIGVEPTQNFVSGFGWIIAHNSLYPSITMTHNVSPETLFCQCTGGDKSGGVHEVPGSDYYFCRDHEGFVSRTVRELVERRRKVKAEMEGVDKTTEEYRLLDSRQSALKILANAIYGYYGYAGSRWYSRVCAQSITAWGRYYIQKVIGKVEGMGYEVIYGDTDSLFVKVKSDKEAIALLDTVNRTLPGEMELEFHGVYPSGLFVPAKTGQAAKKRYALVDSEGELTIRGFEIVRRDWSAIARETQEKVLMAILRDNSPDDAFRIAKRTVSAISGGKVPMEKLVIRTQLTRPIKSYEQIGPHVVAAKKSLAKGRPVAEGALISYIITRGSGSISERAEPVEDAQNYDPNYYINNQVLPAVMRVLAGLGYTEKDLLAEGDVQYSLDRFVRKSPGRKIVDRIVKKAKKKPKRR